MALGRRGASGFRFTGTRQRIQVVDPSSLLFGRQGVVVRLNESGSARIRMDESLPADYPVYRYGRFDVPADDPRARDVVLYPASCGSVEVAR